MQQKISDVVQISILPDGDFTEGAHYRGHAEHG